MLNLINLFLFLAGVYPSSHLVRGGKAGQVVSQSIGEHTPFTHTLAVGGQLESKQPNENVFALWKETLGEQTLSLNQDLYLVCHTSD